MGLNNGSILYCHIHFASMIVCKGKKRLNELKMRIKKNLKDGVKKKKRKKRNEITSEGELKHK